MAGVSRQTVCDYLKGCGGFAEDDAEAAAEACADVENALYLSCITPNVKTGIYNNSSIEFYLTNRDGDRWKKTIRTELTGADGEALPQVLVYVPDNGRDAAP